MLSYKNIPEMLDQIENIALSNDQIENKTGFKVVTYTTILDQYVAGDKSIEKLIFNNSDKFICLILSDQYRGHYVACHLDSNNQFNIYDSYGMGVTKILKFSPFSNNKCAGLDIFYVMCKNSGIKYISNQYQHQRFNSNKEIYMTCGFHSILRLKFHQYDNKEFHDFITSMKNVCPDYVALLMIIILFKE